VNIVKRNPTEECICVCVSVFSVMMDIAMLYIITREILTVIIRQ